MFTTAIAKIAASEKSNDGAEIRRRTDNNEDAEDDLEDQLCNLAFTE